MAVARPPSASGLPAGIVRPETLHLPGRRQLTDQGAGRFGVAHAVDPVGDHPGRQDRGGMMTGARLWTRGNHGPVVRTVQLSSHRWRSAWGRPVVLPVTPTDTTLPRGMLRVSQSFCLHHT
jgi:hypothetical protein